jgi:four helix bundle protein
MSKLRSHKDLDLWKFAMQLAKQTYLESVNLPKEEVYGLTAQIRRAAVSIPSNIAEGAARKGSKEFCHFLYIALGSLAELETQWIISQDLGYTASTSFENNIERVRMMLLGMIRHLKSTQSPTPNA